MNNIAVKKLPTKSSDALETRMNKIEDTLNTFQSSVLGILGAIRIDMAEMMSQPRPFYIEDEGVDEENVFNSLIPLNTMEKFDAFEVHLLDTPFKDNFVSII